MLFVSFVLGGTDYAVEVEEVYGIYHSLPIIPTPDLSPSMEGEVQLVDRRIPVVNLRRFAGIRDGLGQKTPHWILIVDHKQGPIGFMVDGVTEVVRLSPANLTISDQKAPGPVGDYIMAVARHDNKAVYMPDFSRLLHDAVQ
jgi:purine-binding chemotaxis protein CheW